MLQPPVLSPHDVVMYTHLRMRAMGDVLNIIALHPLSYSPYDIAIYTPLHMHAMGDILNVMAPCLLSYSLYNIATYMPLHMRTMGDVLNITAPCPLVFPSPTPPVMYRHRVRVRKRVAEGVLETLSRKVKADHAVRCCQNF
jgi:hypothetical protein